MAWEPPLPEWQVSRWFNTVPGQPPGVAALRGRVILLYAFQMLCPACVSHCLPQAKKLHRLLPPDQVAVIGLHTVFEHHEAMTEMALAAFIHEYGLRFPIGVDAPGPAPRPLTMNALDLQGTPSLIVADRAGRIVYKGLGSLDDLALGVLVGQLMAQAAEPADTDLPSAAEGRASTAAAAAATGPADGAGCEGGACRS